MAKLKDVIEELVTANRILANLGIVDSFGHVSVRHPGNPQRYLLSRARAPAPPRSGRYGLFGSTGPPLPIILSRAALNSESAPQSGQRVEPARSRPTL